VILGLDISTSCTGYCVFNDTGVLVDMGAIKLSGKKDLFEKASQVKSELLKIIVRFPISKICIEENLQAFRPGLSSARTLLTLARFNGIISYISKEVFEISPDFINVNVARKSVGLKIKRSSICGVSTKDQVLEWVKGDIAKSGQSFNWPIKVMKSGPRKGMSVLDTSSYDMADAYVLCAAWMKNNKNVSQAV
jgi:Holliday junction resolvasome RuvABC endonuclease subunit